MSDVVVIGGGTGLSTLGRVLKKLPINLTFIVTITDDGGSSGRLREDLGMPPPGDIRNNLLALADDENLLAKVFSYRFKSDKLLRHSLGNLILAGLTEMEGSFPEAVAAASKLLRIRGIVLPVADALIHLVGKFDDGTILKGETNITKKGCAPKELRLDRPVKALPEVVEAIEKADYIILGPGSLFTSIISNFLVDGVVEAIQKSHGEKVYMSNLMTQPGETRDFTLKQHVFAVEKYAGVKLDRIFWVNLSSIEKREPEIFENYRKSGAVPVENDMAGDSRIVKIEDFEEKQLEINGKKLVLRHSEKSIIKIAKILGIME
ncbi:MAG: YvcK family protein [Kosmotoga sp.]|nr:MAG: YvcK family protein [Kosmotoga sp.]